MTAEASTSPSQPFKRLYADYLRTFAALAVVMIHSVGTYLTQFNPTAASQNDWWASVIYCSFLRWATPFFIMLSGSFFLNPTRPVSTREFLVKRIGRVLTPFAFWTVIYLLYQYRYSFATGTFPTLYELFSKVIFEDVYFHLWFVPMIVGLYLLTPTFQIFIKNATRKDVEYFLAISFIITALQHLLPGLFIVEYVGWLGYIGFYVLGYYLVTYPFSSRQKNILWGTGVLMPFVTIIGTWLLSTKKGAYDQAFFIYFSPNVVIMTSAWFLFIRSYDWGAFAQRFPGIDGWVRRFSVLSFGVYFLHVLIIDVLKNGYLGITITSNDYLGYTLHPLLGAILQANTVVAITVLIIYWLGKIPPLTKWLM